jgi:outer membrane protein OmpA-like peptidoglycan-associated protein
MKSIIFACLAGLAWPVLAQAQSPDSIVLYFDEGTATVRAADLPLLDKAARLYRAGHPILMTVTGSADATGTPEANIRISQRRADSVYHGLVARGIPADRFQIVAKGQTDPVVQADGAEVKNRSAVITWK